MHAESLSLATLLLVAVVMTALHVHAGAAEPIATYARPAGHPTQSRSEFIARHGMVCTSQPLASLAGLDVLRSGGNAVDAAIAANAALGVVEPMSCGIGGDLFALYWDAKTRKLYGLNASGRSPLSLTREKFTELGHTAIPTTGPLSWSVPGCVAGWEDLHKRFGNQPFAKLLEPSIKLAEEGFPVSEIIAASWGGEIRECPDSASTYLPGGRAPKTGEIFRNPRLAASYRLIAEGGANAFYRGGIAQRIVKFSREHGGFLEARDFAEHTNAWVEPVSATYRGHELWELPPNGQGIAALQMLNVLEQHDIKSLGFGSPEYVHLFVEAKKLAYADRAKYYADPDFTSLPVKTLISKEYASERAKLIDPQKAMTNVPAGDVRFETGDTVYLTVVDKDRNCCSLIQSLYFGFGSQVTPGDVGFALQNRGCLFALDDKHANRYEPHKRPFHTIIPAMVTKDGEPWLVYGVMGGDMQPQGHVQVLVNMVDFDMNVQLAGDAARVRHLGSAEPTGEAGDPSGGQVTLEPGLSPETFAALKARGHRVSWARSGYGGYQGIRIDWKNGVLRGGTDPRKDGCALGY